MEATAAFTFHLCLQTTGKKDLAMAALDVSAPFRLTKAPIRDIVKAELTRMLMMHLETARYVHANRCEGNRTFLPKITCFPLAAPTAAAAERVTHTSQPSLLGCSTQTHTHTLCYRYRNIKEKLPEEPQTTPPSMPLAK